MAKNNDEFGDLLAGIFAFSLFFIGLGLLINNNFFAYIGFGGITIVAIVFANEIRRIIKRNKLEDKLYVQLKDDIQNFIHRNGHTSNGKRFGKYSLSSSGIDVIREEFEHRYNIKLRSSMMWSLLWRFVKDEEKQTVINNTFTDTNSTRNFQALSGIEFEQLLLRLFSAMGYTVEHNGKAGDQGADLILSKDNIRTAVQAKRYQAAVSNSAVQEVVASKAVHDCGVAMVITTSTFTTGAYENANANGVKLIDGAELKKLLNKYLNEVWI